LGAVDGCTATVGGAFAVEALNAGVDDGARQLNFSRRATKPAMLAARCPSEIKTYKLKSQGAGIGANK